MPSEFSSSLLFSFIYSLYIILSYFQSDNAFPTQFPFGVFQLQQSDAAASPAFRTGAGWGLDGAEQPWSDTNGFGGGGTFAKN